MKAYIVDDQRAIVEMLIMLLSDLGIEAYGTSESVGAHDAIVALQPDLVLLDIMMPRVDGLTLLNELQHDARTSGIAVILCTASILSPSQSRLFSDSGIGVLSKPFDLEQLHDIVKAVQGRQDAQ